MASRIVDPKKPETKPHGTTKDQIAEMESEGQAQAQATTPEHPNDPNVEEPGDTGAADIVGRTGEEMPEQSHDEVEAPLRKTRKSEETIH